MHISDWSSDVCSSDLSNGNVRFGALGCDAHLFRTAPGDRADIAVREPIGLHHLVTGGFDLGNRIRNFESEDSSAVVQPLAMPCQCKDLSAIGTLPLEHAGCIVQCVSKNMDVCFPPRSEEYTSELQSLMRISYAVFCLTKKKQNLMHTHT